ncbi:glycerophosphodiester phosphodiesterase [Rosistilla oblonga]|uniref:glycerophosphodiester phosphodiesterase n=1 Tax=Rosistilla oblonga TaxID=2527990 RepID=A0A518J0R5_9BACT|nr:glycerophosphodiester phosphodiesterase [Rosistilla oblonga]QDV58924.1 Glycerophosphoryl diester phosphodiesterase precursor [Rosistilla oblonga]
MGNGSPTEHAKIVIAHRGASGYLPEHTLPAKAFAYAVGSDFLEQDVVLSKDDVPLVLHDVHLDTVTDVRQRFPERARDDGRFYAIDLTLDELKSLSVSERFDPVTGQAVFPNRFPMGLSQFRIATLAEELELIQGLNDSTGRDVGIYTEIKRPVWHRQQGKDISQITLAVLNKYGYANRSDNVYVQCFDAVENRRLRDELGCQIRLVQLLEDDDWGRATAEYDLAAAESDLQTIAQYADAIGPSMNVVVVPHANRQGYLCTPLVELAHRCGLKVHPWTLRADALPQYVDSFERLIEIALFEADADGVFSDFPDVTVATRDRLFQAS